MTEEKWNSRKVIMTLVSLGLLTVLPVVYKKLDVADDITMIVIGSIAAAGGLYNAFNTLSKKYGAPSDPAP